VVSFCVVLAIAVSIGCSSGNLSEGKIENKIYDKFVELQKSEVEKQLPYLYSISPEAQGKSKEQFVNDSLKAVDTMKFDSFTVSKREKIGKEGLKERVNFLFTASMEKNGERQKVVEDQDATAILTKKEDGWQVTSIK